MGAPVNPFGMIGGAIGGIPGFFLGNIVGGLLGQGGDTDAAVVEDPPDASLTLGTSEPIPVDVEPFDLLSDDQSDKLTGLSDSVISDLERRMDPNFSVITPEQSDAYARTIGAALAAGNDNVAHMAASSGISPASGVSAQGRAYGASQSANALGNMYAEIGGIDEQARQWALQELEGLREFDLNNLTGIASMAGPGIASGADLSLMNPIDIFNIINELKQLDEAEIAALEAGQPGWGDLIESLGPLLGFVG